MSNEAEVTVLEGWKLIPLERINKRTQQGQAVTLGLKHGWKVQLAKTVVQVHDKILKNGNVKPGKIEEHLWVGGSKGNKHYRINQFYIKKNNTHCDFKELKQFILEN